MARGAIGRGPVHRKKKHTGPTAVRRSPTEGAPDGRHRRSEATRRRLFDAMLALMHELNDIPTTAAVTKRAGVGLRTLFQHFPDATAFYAAFFDHVIMTTLSTMPPVRCALGRGPADGGRACVLLLPVNRTSSDRPACHGSPF
jgi:AcrR family transcriptional regulator